MTNQELAAKRDQLRAKADKLQGRNPLTAMGDYAMAATLLAEIGDELVRRELQRNVGFGEAVAKHVFGEEGRP